MTHPRYASIDAKRLRQEVDAATKATDGLVDSAGSDWRWADAQRWWAAHGTTGPVSEQDVLRYLVARGGAASTVRKTICDISRHHDFHYGTDPCGDRVGTFLAGYTRINGTRARPVDALRPDEFALLCQTAHDLFTPYKAARFELLLTTAYGAWLRGGEAVRTQLNELLADDNNWGVFVPFSKTDRKKKGSTVPFDLPGQADVDLLAVVRAFKAAAESAGLPVHAQTAIGMSVKDPSTSISRGEFANQIRTLKRAAGITRRLSAHSPRRGGATEGVADGLSLEETMRRGRWAHVENAAAYVDVRDDLAADLHVDY